MSYLFIWYILLVQYYKTTSHLSKQPEKIVFYSAPHIVCQVVRITIFVFLFFYFIYVFFLSLKDISTLEFYFILFYKTSFSQSCEEKHGIKRKKLSYLVSFLLFTLFRWRVNGLWKYALHPYMRMYVLACVVVMKNNENEKFWVPPENGTQIKRKRKWKWK